MVVFDFQNIKVVPRQFFISLPYWYIFCDKIAVLYNYRKLYWHLQGIKPCSSFPY